MYNSRITSKLIIVLSLLTGLAFGQKPDEEINLHVYPYLQYATPSSIIIKWETIDPVQGMVSFSEDMSFSESTKEEEAIKLHEIKLTGLKAGTTYHYNVSYGNNKLAPATFTTAPEPGTKNWRMVAYGDNRTYPETHKKIVKQILKLNPSMIIHSGDLVSSGTNYEQWKEQYFDPMRGLAENIAVFPSLGNHERNSEHYYNYMSLPDENDESYYSFDYGNAHFIALNSNAGEAPFDIDSKQTQWLIKDLKEHADATWKIVYFHHPLFRCSPSRGIEPQRWVWQEVFEEYGVDLVVNGHDHYYQRTYAVGNYQGKPSKGVYYLISGGGGAPNYDMVEKNHVASRRSIHHITVMDFMDDRIVGRAIDGEGNVFDAFVYDKESENSPEEFMSYEVYEIERDLADAIIKMPVIDVSQGEVVYDQVIKLNNPFSQPLKMTYSWEVSSAWETNEPKTVLLKPGESIEMDLSAKGVNQNIYPAPAAKLHFQSPEGKLVFRNNTIMFDPIKLGGNHLVIPFRFKVEPTINAWITEASWGYSNPAKNFRNVTDGLVAQQSTEIKIGIRKDILYISGTVEASDATSEKGASERDNKNILKDDHVRVHIGADNDVYTFIINPKGTIWDAKNEDSTWGVEVEAKALKKGKGWQFEMAIPLKELELKGKPLAINFARKDADNGIESEFHRTYGHSNLDLRIPMYKSDWLAIDNFATFKLKK